MAAALQFLAAASNGILSKLDPNTLLPRTPITPFRPPPHSPSTSLSTPYSVRSSLSSNTTASKKWKSQTTLELSYQTTDRFKAFLGKEIPDGVLKEEIKKGTKDLNLWTNGLIYPATPSTGRPPEFSGLTSALRFVGNGEDGLYGYTSELDSARQRAEDGLDRLQKEYQPTVQSLVQRAHEQAQELVKKDKALADAVKLAEKYRLEAEASEAGKAKAVIAKSNLKRRFVELSDEKKELKAERAKDRTEIARLLKRCRTLSENGGKLPHKNSKDIGFMAGSGGAAMDRKRVAR
jgi:hypothetical protein